MFDFIIEYLEAWEAGHVILIDGVSYVPVGEMCEVAFKAVIDTLWVSQLGVLFFVASLAVAIAGAWLINRAVRLWLKSKEENK